MDERFAVALEIARAASGILWEVMHATCDPEKRLSVARQRLTLGLFALLLAGCASAPTAGTADFKETLAQSCPPAVLAGAWGSEAEEPETAFLLDDETFSLVWNGKLAGRARILACAQEEAGQRVDMCDQGVRRSYRFEPAEDGWRVVLPPMGLDVEAVSVRRLAEVPAVFDPRPLPIPPPQPLPPERIAELRAELERRREVDQAVRRGSFDELDWEEMRRIDEENTAWIRELVTEVGWIDRERFGDLAAGAAWLFVQHSGDVPLMMGALPRVKEHGSPGHYALLYDRLTLRLGGEQRYGSQLQRTPEGTWALAPIETLEGIDELRASMGLSTLKENFERFPDGVAPETVEVLGCE